MLDREGFLKLLEEKDEAVLTESIRAMLDTVRIDPLLTQEMWAVLARAKTSTLTMNCLRYPWLFELPALDADKMAMLKVYLQDANGGVGTNARAAVVTLAVSQNPLAGEILHELVKTDHAEVKEQMIKYLEIHQKRQAGLQSQR